MKSARFLAVAAISLLAAGTAVQAESYGGVHSSASALNRADVQAEAIRAASAPNQNVTRGSRGADPFTSTADVAAMRAQAIAAASAPDQNVTGGSRYNSRVISTMKNRFEPAVQASKATSDTK